VANILKGVNSIEGLIAVILMMGFVLILAGPVRRALTGNAEEDQNKVIDMLNQLVAAVKEVAAVNEIQNGHFEKNLALFSSLGKTTASIETVLSNILTETVRGSKK